MRQTLLAILALLSCATLSAEDITTIDWNVLRIDTLQLPIYSETVPLAADYRNYDFAAKIEYPEWADLDSREAEAVARLDVPSRVHVDAYVGTMNRRGVLKISFIPVVRDGDAYRKLTSCRITIEASPKAQRSATRAARAAAPASSVLAAGRWVKIGTTREGVHALTRSQLAKWGFSDPAKVRVYGYGGHLLSETLNPELFFQDLPEVPVYLRSDGTLMFWMNGLTSFDNKSADAAIDTRHTGNYCSNISCYFLTDGEPSLPSEESVAGTTDHTITSFTHTVLCEKDEYAYAPLGRRLFEKLNFSTSASATYTLPTPYPKDGELKARVQICVCASEQGIVTPVINGETQGGIIIGKKDEYAKAVVATRQYAVTGKCNALTVKLERSTFDGHLDYIEATYERALALGDGEDGIVFTPDVEGSATFKVDADGEVVVWRLPEPDLPGARIMPRGDGTFAVADAAHTFVAFRPSRSHYEPQYVGAVANQDLRSDSAEVDMVIITPASGIFDGEAERLSRAHAATDGLRCRVVRADKIYNEFSSGTPDVSAYRMYMKMLYDRQQSAPRYLLLFGDCAADNRMLSVNWLRLNPDNFLLGYESDNSVSDTEAFICEDYFGMLDDGEGGMLLSDMGDVSVGRFTVRSQAEARVVVDKTIAHLEGTSGAWNNRIVVMGDDGDNNSHMKYANDIANIIETVAPDMEMHRVMWDAYKRESSALTNTFPGATAEIERLNTEGVLMFNYTGHASTYVLSHENVVRLDQIKAWTNKHCPLWFTAACDVMPIDGVAENIGEQMVLNADGGATAFVGTTRTVYASQNFYLNAAFCRSLFDVDELGRRNSVGDALRLAKHSESVASTPNKLHYVLIGDPSLVFGNPQYKVVLDSINRQTAGGQLLRAGSRAYMAGHIEDASGSTVKGFNGIISTRVLDSEVTVTCHNAANVSAGPFVYTDRNKVLYEGSDSVRAGKFGISFVVPVDINYSGKAGRVNFYASAADSLEANGHSSDFLVGGISDELAADTLGPQMFVSLGDDEFVEGGKVNSTPCFMATLYDESGINIGNGGIGHNLELKIDGKADMTYDLAGYYTAEPGVFGRGHVAFTIPALEQGEHTLTFRACDLLNNASVRSLSFVVDKNFSPDVSKLALSPNPATTYTNIYVTHNCTGSRMDVEVTVYDYAGRLLTTFTRTGADATKTVYMDWDLTTSAGARLGVGVYLLRARICRDGVWSDGEAQKLFITKQ